MLRLGDLLLQVIDVQLAQLWFSGKEMIIGKKLKDYLGMNEKTKIIVKLQKRGAGKPAREPLMSEEERKQLMLHAYRRQEQLKVSESSILLIKQFSSLSCIHVFRDIFFSNFKSIFLAYNFIIISITLISNFNNLLIILNR